MNEKSKNDRPARPRAASGRPGGPRDRGAKNGDRPQRSHRSGPDRGGPDRAKGDRRPDRGPVKPGRDNDRPKSDEAPARKPLPAGLESRYAALEILDRVHEGATLEDALARTRPFENLEGSDRGFARALASETLRRRGAIDHIIGGYLDRPLPKKSARVMDILRIAAAQSLLMDTPPHAAVSTSVDLANDRAETKGYSSLVNAIARKIAADGPAILEKLPARTDTPSWLWRSWERAYGPNGVKAIAEAHRKPAPLDLSFKPGEDLEAWRDRFVEAGNDARIMPTGTIRMSRISDVSSLPGYDDGAWWIQDLAASLPAKLLGDVAGKRVFDLCSAPGGKTLQLAALGGKVTSLDKSGARLERVVTNLKRSDLTAFLVEEDVLRYRPEEKADAILLDAPCTATGTIRRHPDIPWNKGETTMTALADLQGKMIDHAISLLKPGCVFVYCVCSLQREEGEVQAKAALKRNPSIERVPVRPEEIGGLEKLINRDGDLRTTPAMLSDDGGLDGFFAARFKHKD
ncbi:transcription antitermination factor NusB [Hyphococcus formosus]|uniref:RsmB/NOP family class I SAM-dependent RNA methyltransferase n=1 Tax=Hyphococcus formosus TaxID=3143534 RepID=UPI00398AEF2F